MRIGVLGTGMVGRAHSEKLAEKGYDVVMGTRDVNRTKGDAKPGPRGETPMKEWLENHPHVKIGTFYESADHGEMVINALHGTAVLDTLGSVKAALQGKALMDISNPLDYSKGMPPSLWVVNTDSLGEMVQKALPEVKVVKALNTMNAHLQADPMLVANGQHSAFICGNDASAKTEVRELMRIAYGWTDVVDLGPIVGARGMEMYLILWSHMLGAMKSPMFNVKVVKGK